MTFPLVIWASRRVDHACSLDELTGVEGQYALNIGAPLADTFPEGACFTMDPDTPYDTLLTDSLANLDLLIVVSPRLKQLLEGWRLAKVEYLPVTILNHKHRPAGTHFIVHPVEPVDCLDVPRCGATFGAVDKDNILDLKRLAIDPRKIDPARSLFRPRFFYQVVLVNRELAAAISAAGFTGVRWVEVADYPEI